MRKVSATSAESPLSFGEIRLPKWLNWFLESNWFLFFVAVLAALAWAFHWEIAGPVVFGALACFLLIARKDLTPFLAVVCLFLFSYYFEGEPAEPEFYPPLEMTQTYRTAMLAACGAGFLCLIWYIYREFVRKRRKPNFGKLWTGMALAGFACLLSGILCPTYEKINMLSVLGTSLAVYALYFLVLNCTDACDLRRFACKILMVAAFVAVAEMLVFFAGCHDLQTVIESKTTRIGWGVTNNIASLLLMAIPATFYLMLEERQGWTLMFAVLVFCMALFITFSRGNILIALFVIPAAFVYTLIKSPYRFRILLATGGALLLFGLFFLCFSAELSHYFSFFFDFAENAGDRGRIILWQAAWQRFLENPVFGCGFMKDGNGTLWMVHCTPLEILSSAGVVGVLGCVLFYLQRFGMIFRRFSAFRFFALLILAAFELYGLIDVMLFSFHTIYVYLFLVAAEKETPDLRKPFRGVPHSLSLSGRKRSGTYGNRI